MLYYVFNPSNNATAKFDRYNNAYYFAMAKFGLMYRKNRKNKRVVCADFRKIGKEYGTL